MYLDALTETGVNALIDAINEQRFEKYAASVGSQRDALRLYSWNAVLARQSHDLIGAFEISLRNRVSKQIVDHFDREDWYRCRKFTSLLAKERRGNISETRRRIERGQQEVNTGRVVAGLTLNFWVSLHEGKYRDVFWTPFLRHVWPKGSNAKKVRADLTRIRDFRNRIAHYEPIFTQKWRSKPAIVFTRLKEIDRVKHDWMEHRLEREMAHSIDEIEALVGP